ncbi:hypothetical protein CC1G_09738 [Coprinopsis cinerea okayama7|uniref:Uncharacterized protein n=1 Tax=Coprinopsis cinerea (strain Okayama-7 / 130 / ATCC MYA-4618 / FGSC 9003) TaxID=240176 RepID=A8PDY2_COPC7|nr:hypothetical protein CC1G_09738 [Coprinopsis cinerea okayama7\|eukprot:XP_001840687.2 hypothetical protein CC1G_09738 [Coprinopsis cinerea okayama7\
MEFPTTHWFRSDWTELPKFTRFNSASIDAYGHTRHDTAGASFVAFLSYFVFLILSYLRSVSLLSFSVSCACIRVSLHDLSAASDLEFGLRSLSSIQRLPGNQKAYEISTLKKRNPKAPKSSVEARINPLTGKAFEERTTRRQRQGQPLEYQELESDRALKRQIKEAKAKTTSGEDEEAAVEDLVDPGAETESEEESVPPTFQLGASQGPSFPGGFELPKAESVSYRRLDKLKTDVAELGFPSSLGTPNEPLYFEKHPFRSSYRVTESSATEGDFSDLSLEDLGKSVQSPAVPKPYSPLEASLSQREEGKELSPVKEENEVELPAGSDEVEGSFRSHKRDKGKQRATSEDRSSTSEPTTNTPSEPTTGESFVDFGNKSEEDIERLPERRTRRRKRTKKTSVLRETPKEKEQVNVPQPPVIQTATSVQREQKPSVSNFETPTHEKAPSISPLLQNHHKMEYEISMDPRVDHLTTQQLYKNPRVPQLWKASHLVLEDDTAAEVWAYIERMETMFEQASVVLDRHKKKALVDFVKKVDLKDQWSRLTQYRDGTYAQFKAEILSYYPGIKELQGRKP